MATTNWLIVNVRSLILAGVAAAGTFVLIGRYIPPDLLVIVSIVLGLIFWEVASTISGMSDRAASSVKLSVRINETMLSALIKNDHEAPLPKSTASRPRESRESFEVTAAQLIGIDNNLALAKLRMDIESEVRRIAFNSGIDIALRLVNTRTLVQDLALQDTLPLQYVDVIDEVLAACNKAVHGYSVSVEAAPRIVMVGDQLLDEFRTRYGERSHVTSDRPRK